MQQIDDKTWHGFLTGSKSAFKRVYESYFGLVNYVAARLEDDPVERDDIVQEVFLKCWQSRSSIESAKHLGAWLSVTTRRTAIDKWRSKERTEKFITLSSELDNDMQNTEARSIEDRIDWRLIRSVTTKQALQDGDDILELFYFKELTILEIAELKNLAPSTITTNLTRARRKLIQALAKMGITRE